MRYAAIAALALGLVTGAAGTAEARDGCGPGFHRGFHGVCRPNFGPRPFVYGYGYRPYRSRVGWYGGPRFHRGGYGWHRGYAFHRGPGWHGGFRHAGWHHRW